MDRVKIISFIQHIPAFVQNPDTLLLREAVKKYPGFNTLYLLLALAKNQTDSIFTQEYLEQAAIYAGSRSRLKDLLTRDIRSDVSKQEPLETKEARPPKKIDKPEEKSIIDDFIKKNPSIQRPKTAFYSPVDAASKSISEDEEFYTETLAKIHVRQKNYEKAIKIYQKLSLIYPEKSDYFAHLINGLKSKTNE